MASELAGLIHFQVIERVCKRQCWKPRRHGFQYLLMVPGGEPNPAFPVRGIAAVTITLNDQAEIIEVDLVPRIGLQPVQSPPPGYGYGPKPKEKRADRSPIR